jgi:hypothetical protein
MITNDMLTAWGFHQPAGTKDWHAKEFRDVWLVPYSEGRYRANIGAQARFVSNETDLKKFVELMFVIATHKELD